MGDEWSEIFRGGIAQVTPWTIVAACIYAILRGLLIPRQSHEEIVNGYKERTVAAEAREQWWREQAFSGTAMASRSVDLAADLATRRAIVASARGVDMDSEHDE